MRFQTIKIFRYYQKSMAGRFDEGLLYYTCQCPFNAKYVPMVAQTAKKHDIPFRSIQVESKEEARNAPTPITTYALFYDGEYLTNEPMNDKKFLKLSSNR